MPIFWIFIIIPLIELSLFVAVSEEIGIWTTIALAFLTAIIGGGLVKYQGLQTLIGMRHAMDRGEMPVLEIFDGFCLVAAGVLLITPGFLTDFIGFSLLIPKVRSEIKAVLLRSGKFNIHSSGGFEYEEHRSSSLRQGDVIEGEYEEVKDPHDKRDQS